MTGQNIQSPQTITGQKGSGAVEPNSPTFAIEHVAAKLVPFDMNAEIQRYRGSFNSQDPSGRSRPAPNGRQPQGGNVEGRANTFVDGFNAMGPIIQTGGLVFPYNPAISEGVSVNYDSIELTHSNESYHAYKSTDNVRISLSDCVWTCDTFDNAVYALSVLHFLRSYSLMDFGRRQSGRPPSPMWFSAYGNYAFYRTPVLMEKADWTFPNDVDYVGIPEFGSQEYQSRQLKYRRTADNSYTWMPVKFTVSSISLIVQHTPKYWTNFSLSDYRSGNMLRSLKSFHATRNRPSRQTQGGRR